MTRGGGLRRMGNVPTEFGPLPLPENTPGGAFCSAISAEYLLHHAQLLYNVLDRQIVSFSEARQSFKAVLDRVVPDTDVTLIIRRHIHDAVVMSLDTDNKLMKTVHLLRSPAHTAHLQRSLERAERGELLEQPL